LESVAVEYKTESGSVSQQFSNTPPVKGNNSITFTTATNYIGQFRIAVVADGVTFYSDYRPLALAANYSMITSNNTAELNSADNILEITKSPNPSSYGKTAFATNISGSSIRAYAVMPTGMTKYDYGSWPTFRTKVLPDLHLFGAITGTISSFITGADYGISAASTNNTKPVNYSFNRAFTWPFSQSYTITEKADVDFNIGIWNSGLDEINLYGEAQYSNSSGETITLSRADLTTVKSHLGGRTTAALLSRFEFKIEHVSGSTEWSLGAPNGTAKGTWFKATNFARIQFPSVRTARTYTVKVSARLADNPAVIMENNLTININ
jgi:hypothetical protein